jgi:hypothetical protein
MFASAWIGELGYLSEYSVWLQTGQPRVDPRQRQKNFSSSLWDQTSSEAHPASHPMGTRGPLKLKLSHYT